MPSSPVHLYDDRFFAVQIKFVRYLATRKSAAYDHYALADLLVFKKEINRFDRVFFALYRDTTRF